MSTIRTATVRTESESLILADPMETHDSCEDAENGGALSVWNVPNGEHTVKIHEDENGEVERIEIVINRTCK